MQRILLVEDNEVNREMLARRLLKRGFDVLLAADGEQALATASTKLPDLILLDMSLPVMSGWDAARHLKGSPCTQKIPIIALTGHAMESDRVQALAAGCDFFHAKPVELPRLLDIIAQALNQGAVAHGGSGDARGS